MSKAMSRRLRKLEQHQCVSHTPAGGARDLLQTKINALAEHNEGSALTKAEIQQVLGALSQYVNSRREQ